MCLPTFSTQVVVQIPVSRSQAKAPFHLHCGTSPGCLSSVADCACHLQQHHWHCSWLAKLHAGLLKVPWSTAQVQQSPSSPWEQESSSGKDEYCLTQTQHHCLSPALLHHLRLSHSCLHCAQETEREPRESKSTLRNVQITTVIHCPHQLSSSPLPSFPTSLRHPHLLCPGSCWI